MSKQQKIQASIDAVFDDSAMGRFCAAYENRKSGKRQLIEETLQAGQILKENGLADMLVHIADTPEYKAGDLYKRSEILFNGLNRLLGGMNAQPTQSVAVAQLVPTEAPLEPHQQPSAPVVEEKAEEPPAPEPKPEPVKEKPMAKGIESGYIGAKTESNMPEQHVHRPMSALVGSRQRNQ